MIGTFISTIDSPIRTRLTIHRYGWADESMVFDFPIPDCRLPMMRLL